MQNTAETLNDESSTRREVIFHKIPFFFAVIFLCVLSCPPVSDLIGMMGKLSLLAIIFLSEIILHGSSDMLNVFRHRVKEIVLLFLWVFVLSIYKLYEIGDMETLANYLEPLMYFISTYLIGALYLTRPNNNKVLALAVILTIGITSAFLVRLIYGNPGIVRFYTFNPYIFPDSKMPLVGSISYYTCITPLTPFIFGLLKLYINNIKIFLIMVAFALPIFLSIILSTLLVPLVITIIGLTGMVYLSYRSGEFSRKGTIILSVAFCVFFIIFFISDMEQSIYIKEKIISTIASVSEGKTDQVNRSYDALKSIDTFSENPFFGIGPQSRGRYNEVGEHSAWIDLFTEFGIIGFLPFILFLIFAWSRVYTAFRSDPRQLWNQVYIVAFLLYFIAGLLNPWAFNNYYAVFFAAMTLGPSSIAEDPSK
jgi:O-antigen ligase